LFRFANLYSPDHILKVEIMPETLAAPSFPMLRAQHAPAITLTGVDDATDPKVLQSIVREQEDIEVEWGVLYSTSRAGSGRYPSLPKIDALAAIEPALDAPRLSLHICGGAVRDFLAGTGHVSDVASRFWRIQLNLRAKDHDPRALLAAIERCAERGQTVITQHNAANASLRDTLLRLAGDAGLPNHAILFDASGGRGTLPSEWPRPVAGVACGYAGGLGPKNLDRQLMVLTSHGVMPGEAGAWVDMESALRDESDLFSMRLCLECIESVARFRRVMARWAEQAVEDARERLAKQAPKSSGN